MCNKMLSVVIAPSELIIGNVKSDDGFIDFDLIETCSALNFRLY